MIFGIDVSHWQGNFDFEKAKKEGVQYAIIKAGGGDAGLYQDSKFNTFYTAAKAAGLGVGTYFFGQAFSVEAAEKEADKFISILKGKQFDYPVYYDVEAKMLNQDKGRLTDIVIAFCNKMEKAGYFAGVYSSESFFNSNMDDTRLSRFAHWVAKYSKNAPVLRSGNAIGMWQYGASKNYIRSNLIAGVVCDQDYCYEDYPSKIKAAGLNGYTVNAGSSNPTPAKTVDELAREVINGMWGNGDERKAKLKAAGYDYAAVQKRVNELLAPTAPAKKSNQEIAQEVIKGLWGNGEERKKKLKAAGYDYAAVQKIVNKLMS